MNDIYNVRTSRFIYFRRLVRYLYKQGYVFRSNKKHNPFSMWIGLIGLNPVRGLEVNTETKQLKYFDIKNWDYLSDNFISHIEYIDKLK